MGDAAVHTGLASLEEIGECVALRKKWPDIANAREAVPLINGLAESPRESDVRVALYENGYPPPIQQAEIRTARGYFIGRVDFFYPERSLVLEYDGRGKTRGIDGGDPYKAINKERDRERSLISEAIIPIRITNDSFVSGAWRDCGTRVARFPQHSGAPPCQVGWRGERTRNWCGCPWGDRLPGRGRGSRRGSPRLGGRRNPRG